MDISKLTLNQSLNQSTTETKRPERNRAWRRTNDYLHRHNDQKRPSSLGRWTASKNWKYLYTSGAKRSRARQLKIEYPRISNQQRRLNATCDFWNNAD